jgi:hypothetical protein
LRVDWVIPCRYVEVNDGLATVVGAGVDHYTVPSLPTPLQVPTAIRLVGLPDDEEHRLNITILSPLMESATDEPMFVTFRTQKNALLPDGWESATLIPAAVVFMASAEGAYTFTVEVDGSSKSIPIRVKAADSGVE